MSRRLTAAPDDRTTWRTCRDMDGVVHWYMVYVDGHVSHLPLCWEDTYARAHRQDPGTEAPTCVRCIVSPPKSIPG